MSEKEGGCSSSSKRLPGPVVGAVGGVQTTWRGDGSQSMQWKSLEGKWRCLPVVWSWSWMRRWSSG